MKARLVGLSLVAGATCFAGRQWSTELLVDREYAMPIFNDHGANIPRAAVSREGVPVYTVWWSPVLTQAYQYKTNLNYYYYGPSAGAGMATDLHSRAGFVADTGDSLHVNVGDRDYYQEVLPPGSEGVAVGIKSLDDNGTPFWNAVVGGTSYVFRGTDQLNPAQYSKWALDEQNHRGDCVWTGTTTESGNRQFDVFLNYMNLSKNILGADRYISWAHLNDKGDVLWGGSGSLTDNQSDLFLNGRNLTHNFGLPEDRMIASGAINNQSDILWWYQEHAAGGPDHLMKNSTELSTIDGRFWSVGQLQSEMDENGNVLWAGYNDELGPAVILNQKVISTGLIGPLGEGNTVDYAGMDRWNNVAWYGGGELTGYHNHVFVNDFDLSMDYFGDQSCFQRAACMAIGANGHVLWTALMPDRTWSVYLSTPVPEPSLWTIAFPVAALAVCMRRGRIAGGSS